VSRTANGKQECRDGHVKAIVTARFSCSYTGVANLGGDSAEWIASKFATCDHDKHDWLMNLAGALTTAFRTRRHAGLAHAVAAVGWVPQGLPFASVPTGFSPLMTVVSNFDPSAPPRAVVPDFLLTEMTVAPGRLCAVVPLGQTLTPDELKNVNRAVKRLCVSKRDTPRAIAQVLVECVRQVARAGDTRSLYVSQEVLITSWPRPDLLRDRLVIGKLIDGYVSVTFVPAGSSRRELPGGPILVGRGVAIEALTPEDGPPGPGEGPAMRIVKRTPGASFELWFLTDPPLGAAWSLGDPPNAQR
jgi:hypothetical protein